MRVIYLLVMVFICFISILIRNQTCETYTECNKLIDSKPIDIHTIHNSPFYEKTLTDVKQYFINANIDSFQKVVDLMNKTIQSPPFYQNVYEINRETGNHAVIYREGMPFGFHMTHSPVIVHGIVFSDHIHSLINAPPIHTGYWYKNNFFLV
jgi:hypothetical protein